MSTAGGLRGVSLTICCCVTTVSFEARRKNAASQQSRRQRVNRIVPRNRHHAAAHYYLLFGRSPPNDTRFFLSAAEPSIRAANPALDGLAGASSGSVFVFRRVSDTPPADISEPELSERLGACTFASDMDGICADLSGARDAPSSTGGAGAAARCGGATGARWSPRARPPFPPTPPGLGRFPRRTPGRIHDPARTCRRRPLQLVR